MLKSGLILPTTHNTLKQGLVGHWKMDEVVSGQVKDQSGNGNHANVTGTMDVKRGAFGKSLAFSSSDYLVVPDAYSHLQEVISMTKTQVQYL